tara:strand:- start:1287 stop:2084 length:798 start_codon:yes stop_codon:yes gene_type:complete
MFDLQYIIFGLVQGITEFLPISSSAHLILVSEYFQWNNQSIFVDIAVHFGTLGAVIAYLYKDLLSIFLDFFSFRKSNFQIKKNHGLKIVIATIPAVLVGFIIYQYFIFNLRSLLIIAYANIFFGLFLYISDKYSPCLIEWKELSFFKALIIGLFQSLAFIPGASRAGVTITGGRLLGLKRESAAIYSMLLSIPIILASITLALTDISFDNSSQLDMSKILISTLVAFITALVSINFMMNILKKTDFTIFIIYRIVLGIIIILFIN